MPNHPDSQCSHLSSLPTLIFELARQPDLITCPSCHSRTRDHYYVNEIELHRYRRLRIYHAHVIARSFGSLSHRSRRLVDIDFLKCLEQVQREYPGVQISRRFPFNPSDPATNLFQVYFYMRFVFTATWDKADQFVLHCCGCIRCLLDL